MAPDRGDVVGTDVGAHRCRASDRICFERCAPGANAAAAVARCSRQRPRVAGLRRWTSPLDASTRSRRAERDVGRLVRGRRVTLSSEMCCRGSSGWRGLSMRSPGDRRVRRDRGGPARFHHARSPGTRRQRRDREARWRFLSRPRRSGERSRTRAEVARRNSARSRHVRAAHGGGVYRKASSSRANTCRRWSHVPESPSVDRGDSRRRAPVDL